MQVRATAADRHTMSPVYTTPGDPYDGDAKKGLWDQRRVSRSTANPGRPATVMACAVC